MKSNNVYLVITVFFAFSLITVISAQSIELTGRILEQDRYRAVAQYSDYIYCGGIHGLSIYHLDDNDSLILVNTQYHEDIVDIAIDSCYAFVARDDINCLVLDLSDPANPTVINEFFNGFNHFFDIQIFNSIIYVSYTSNIITSSVKMIDFSDPYNLVEIDILETELGVYFHVNEDLLVILAGEYDLSYTAFQIYDVSDPYNISLTYDEQEYCWYYSSTVAVYDDYAYVGFRDSTKIYDISDPNDIQFIVDNRNFLVSNYIIFQDTLGFMGTRCYNFSNPLNPQLIGDFYFRDGYFDFSKNDELSAIISRETYESNYSVSLIDWSMASEPRLINTFDTPEPSEDVAINGDYAYIANGADGITVVNISNPNNPAIVRKLYDIGTIDNLCISNNLAYYQTKAGFKLFNISSADNPQQIINYRDYDFLVYDMSVDGDFAYQLRMENGAYQNKYLAIFNISNPSNPELVQSIDISAEGYQKIIVKEGYAYLSVAYGNLAIFDLRNPEQPEQVGVYEKRSINREFDIAFPYLYICSCYHGLEIVNIADPSNPYLENIGDSLSNITSYINVHEQYAYTTYSDTIKVFDISNPYEYEMIAIYHPSGTSFYARQAPRAEGEYIYDANITNFQILHFTPTGIEQVAQLPTSTSLYPNYPNPFNAQTTIRYELPKSSQVMLDIYDILGRKVQTLYDGPQTAGEHTVIFLDNELASGVYFYKLTTGNNTYTQRMTLLK